jgi:hypothetical protein
MSKIDVETNIVNGIHTIRHEIRRIEVRTVCSWTNWK